MASYRLPHDMQDDLTWFWCEAESEMGVRSSTGALIDRLELRIGMARSGREQANDTEPRTIHWRRARIDAALRLYCLFGTVHDSDQFRVRDPMPDAAARARDRSTRIHSAVVRLVQLPGGPGHTRVLHRVYGPATRHPLCYGRVGSELAPLIEYTPMVWDTMRAESCTAQEAGEKLLRKSGEKMAYDLKEQAQALLVSSSRAFYALYQDEKRSRQETRRAKFREILGAA
jgi:hypothetical protein